jgi:hypothetical protein
MIKADITGSGMPEHTLTILNGTLKAVHINTAQRSIRIKDTQMCLLYLVSQIFITYTLVIFYAVKLVREEGYGDDDDNSFNSVHLFMCLTTAKEG